jgi:hypothetical protein
MDQNKQIFKSNKDKKGYINILINNHRPKQTNL